VRGNARVLLAATGGPDELALALREAGPEQPGAAGVLEEAARSFRQRRVIPTGDWAEALRGWLKGPLRPQAIVLSGLWKVESFRGELEAAGAFESLADLGGGAAAAFLAGKAGLGEPPERARAVAALERLDLAAAAQAASRLLCSPEGPGQAESVVGSFLVRQGASEALARALQGKGLSADAAKLGLRAMSSAGRWDEALRGVLGQAAGITSGAPEYSTLLVQSLGDEAKSEGDPARGEKVFRGTVTNCLSCHAIGGAGGKVGPDLSAVGTGLPVDLVVESVLWPNRQVKEGYHSTAVITKDDVIIQGFKVNEDKQTLVLRDPNQEQPIRIPIAQIKARKEIGSVMPEGLTNGLTRAELRDLIRFLCDLGKPGPFRLPDRPLVRRWEEKVGDRWVPRFSTVSGELPVQELSSARATIRFDVDILRAGQVMMRFNTGRGVTLRNSTMRLEDSFEFHAPVSRQQFVLEVDREARGGSGLQIQLEPAPGSQAEIRLLN
jgi:putative heme-binding domain-containing protein